MFGLAGSELLSTELLGKEAAVILAVGVVLAGLGTLLLVAKVIFHQDEAPYRRLRGLLNRTRPE